MVGRSAGYRIKSTGIHEGDSGEGLIRTTRFMLRCWGVRLGASSTRRRTCGPLAKRTLHFCLGAPTLCMASILQYLFCDCNYPVIDTSSKYARGVIWEEEERILRDEHSAYYTPISGLWMPPNPGYGAVFQTPVSVKAKSPQHERAIIPWARTYLFVHVEPDVVSAPGA